MLVIYSIMFVIVYPLESVIYTLLMGPLGVVAAWFSLYLQADVISKFLVTIMLLPYIQKVAYDAVLSRECYHVYSRFHASRSKEKQNLRYNQKLRKYFHELPDISIFPYTVTRLVFLFFINLIPVIGPLIVFFFKASSKGLQAHNRYFKLKGYTRKEIRANHKQNKAVYTAFGVTALLLEMIPVINIFFMFTNTIGAALWVVDLEKANSIPLSLDISHEADSHSLVQNKPLALNNPHTFSTEALIDLQTESPLHTGSQLQAKCA